MSSTLYNNTIDIEYIVDENTSEPRTAQIVTEYNGTIVDIMNIKQAGATNSGDSGNNSGSQPENPGTSETPDIDINFDDIKMSMEELKSKIYEYKAKLDISAYTNAYNLALTTIDSYIDRETDDYGCILLEENEIYPLSNLDTYYDELNSILNNYEASQLFYAELNGNLSEFKIAKVNKLLTGLEKDYKDLKDITDKNVALTESLINGWKEDNVISIEEQSLLKMKLDEISSEYVQISNYVNELINIYSELTTDKNTAFIEADVELFLSNLTTEFESYKKSYDKVNEVITYYTTQPDENKTDLGGVVINANYDVNCLTDFYKTREKLLATYYEANAYYTTYNRFGSKTVWIGDDGIYAGTISADNLRGWCIEGLTLQSGHKVILPSYLTWYQYNKDAANQEEAFTQVNMNSSGVDGGPSWQIYKDGSGHLAAGNISWSSEGNVTLGDGVSIKWKQVSDGDSVLNEELKNLKDELLDKINTSTEGITQQDLDNFERLINAQYENKLRELYERLHAEGDENKDSLRAEIDKIENDLDNANKAVAVLQESLKGLQGGTDEDGNPGSVLNPQDVRDIMAAALIDETFWTDDMIGSETVMGKNIIGLVGKFGWVKASSISGDLINGKTVQSANKTILKNGTKYYEFGSEDAYGNVSSNSITADGKTNEGPTWQLKQDGSGYLGKGGISWDAEGDVKLNGVQIKWSDIDQNTVPDFGGGGNPEVDVEPSKFKSIVFKRGEDLSSELLSGGSWDSPYPEQTGWEDGIPTGTGPVWMASRIFRSDNKHDWSDVNFKTEWTTPKLMVDTESYEIAYGTQEVENNSTISEGLPKTNGFADLSKDFEKGWTDEPVDGVEYYYMATANCDNGKWSTWTVSKIKGEKGTDGTSIKVSGSYDTSEEFISKHYSNGQAVPPKNAAGEIDYSMCYVVVTDLYVWDQTNATWKNVGPFKGDPGAPGETYYLYVKYAKTTNADDTGTATEVSLTTNEGEDTKDAKWMGIGHGTAPKDPNPGNNLGIYKWTKIVTEPIIIPTQYKAIAFTRQPIGTDIGSIVPKGGNWSDAKPNSSTDIIWSDGIPGGEGGIIWSTSRTFIANEDFSNANNITWSLPIKMLDEPGKFETAYGTSEVIKTDGTIDESGLPTEDGYKDSPAKPGDADAYTLGWYDEPENIPTEKGDAIYMATATCNGGIWTPWHIVKIKGEKGDKGAGIKYKGTLNTIQDLPTTPDEFDDAYIVATDPSNTSDKEWNHLFAWTGEDPNQNSFIDGHYRGWSDTGKFNGKDGKTTYVYIKYADHIEFNDNKIVPSKCVLSGSDGESRGRWMGLGNGFEENEPTLVSGATGYSDENWSKYKWTDLTSNVTDAVTTVLGTYHISSNHIAGKVIDNAVDANGDENYVTLKEGTKYVTFTKNADGDEIKSDENTANGTSDKGPSWQIRDDGTGYFAKGNIAWNNNGDLDIAGKITAESGDVTIGGGVGVGPWNTFTENGLDFIGDGKTFDTSTNAFSSNGIFKIGGEDGIVKESKDGNIKIGSAVEFGSGEDSFTIEYQANMSNGAYNGTYVYLGNQTWKNLSNNTSLNLETWMYKNDFNNFSFDKTKEKITLGYTTKSASELKATGETTSVYGMVGAITYDSTSKTFNYNGTINNIGSFNSYEYLGPLTEGYVTEIIGKTEIDGAKIKTGSITTTQIDADNLSVKQLNTTPGKETQGTIKIEDNDIIVYDKSKSRRVLTLTGDTLSKMPINITISPSYKTAKYIYEHEETAYNDIQYSSCGTYSLGTFQIPENEDGKGYTYILDANKGTASLNCSLYDIDSWPASITTNNYLQYGFEIVISKSSKVPDSADLSTNNKWYIRNNATSSYNIPVKWYDGTTISSKMTCPAGTYYIYLRYRFAFDYTDPNKYNNITLGVTASAGTITIEPDVYAKCDISSYGFKYIVNKEKYVVFDKDGNFTLRNGDNVIQLDDEGNIWMGFKNGDKPLTSSSQSSIKAYKLTPRTYKFRLQGDTNQHMTVLTLGDSKVVTD
jgi:hypothetical protein